MLTLVMRGPCLTMTSYPRKIPLILSSGGGFQVINSQDSFSWTVTFRGNTDGTGKDKKQRKQREWDPETYRSHIEKATPCFHWNLYLQLCVRPLPSSVETGQLNNPLRWRKEGNLEEPHPWNVFSEFPMWPFGRGKKCGAQVDATFLWRGLAVSNAHSCFCTLLPEAWKPLQANR